MALNNRKQLHAHTVPFLIIGVGFIVATTLLTYVVFKPDNDQSITRLVTVRLYDVKPSSNGLVHISRHSETSIKGSRQNRTSGLDGTGKSASLQATVYAKQ